MDQDPISDDLLAETVVDEGGIARFRFDLAAASSADSLFEERPDLYVVLMNTEREVLRTPVQKNVDVLRVNPITGFRDGTTVDLGTVQVDD